MALRNPAFDNPAFQDPKAVKSYPGGRQAAGLTPPAAPTQYATAQHAGTDIAAQAQLEGMYAAPAAGAIETDRMSVEDTVWKTVGLFAVLLVTAVGGWIWSKSSTSEYAAMITTKMPMMTPQGMPNRKLGALYRPNAPPAIGTLKSMSPRLMSEKTR